MKRFLRADPCCRSVIKEFAHAFSKMLELLSAAPRATLAHFSCSPNFPRASITRYMHAKHEQIHNYMIGKIILIQIHISSVWFIPIYEENFLIFFHFLE